ncbi:hypothetical protein P43SY_009221 [Pythium insidiosum]|uniref:Purple acid phosphatase n=1 Tax=Pythium insidiosum TaxID=114742 RepID=A0AAD5Q9V3_PYTIN|nr:hypothetical protein P43SY_009221 [Pythium insidiosum]
MSSSRFARTPPLLLLSMLAMAMAMAARPRANIDFTTSPDDDARAFSPAAVQASEQDDDAHYWWLRGGAWQFHEALHPCQLFNQTCVFLDAADDEDEDDGAELLVNTTIVPHMGMVEVAYAVRDGVRDGDFIGVYCVDEEDPMTPSGAVGDHDFFDYALLAPSAVVTATPAADAEGEDSRRRLRLSSRGRVAFGPLVNMRCSFQFRYIRQLAPLRYVALGASPFVEMERGHSEPLQVQLALTGRADEMRVMWTSGRGRHPHVHFGSERDVLDRHAEANTTTYAVTELCHDPATIVSARWFRHPGYRHDAVMTGLSPGKTYYYRVGSRYGVQGRLFSFRHPPSPSPATSQPQSFFVFGDLGEGVLEPLPRSERKQRQFEMTEFRSRPRSWSPQTVMRRIQQDVDEDHDGRYVAVVHIGDLAYAKGRTYLWDQFGAVIEPVASKLAYMIGVGNHEYDYTLGGQGHDLSGDGVGDTNGCHPRGSNYGNDSKGECGVPTAKRFRMPANGNGVFWYSFSLGLSHHIVLSSEHDCDQDSPMRRWLESELAQNVDRSRTPWLFVHLHRPLYCSEKYASDLNVSRLLRQCLEDVLLEHRVDAVFAGHYHAYERTCPVAKEVCRLDAATGRSLAPVHFMIGSGGAELDDIDYVLDKKTTAWSANHQQDYGYGRLHVHNKTHVHFEFVRARDRVVSDNTWIVSTHDWAV